MVVFARATTPNRKIIIRRLAATVLCALPTTMATAMPSNLEYNLWTESIGVSIKRFHRLLLFCHTLYIKWRFDAISAEKKKRAKKKWQPARYRHQHHQPNSQCFAPHELFIPFWCFAFFRSIPSKCVRISFVGWFCSDVRAAQSYDISSSSEEKHGKKIKVSFFNLINDWRQTGSSNSEIESSSNMEKKRKTNSSEAAATVGRGKKIGDSC